MSPPKQQLCFESILIFQEELSVHVFFIFVFLGYIKWYLFLIDYLNHVG